MPPVEKIEDVVSKETMRLARKVSLPGKCFICDKVVKTQRSKFKSAWRALANQFMNKDTNPLTAKMCGGDACLEKTDGDFLEKF